MGQNGKTRISKGLIPILLLATVLAASAAELPVWTGGDPIANRLGGSYGSYGSAGCRVNPGLDASGALEIRYSNQSSGPCGFFMHLYDETRQYVDLTRFPFLHIVVQGAPAGEVRLADGVLLAKEDSVSAGLLKSGDNVISTVNVRLRKREAASLSIAFPEGSNGVFLLSAVVFSDSPKPVHADLQANKPMALPARSRAMWFWEFGDCLTDAKVCDRVFAFAKQHNIDTIYGQVSYRCAAKCDLDKPDALRQVLRNASEVGLRIQALDGAPEFALTQNHPQMIALAQAILAFNHENPPNERFSGIHFDIEPYLLLGFNAHVREPILLQYLELNRKVADLIHSSGADRIEFGADIPFWYDEAQQNGVNPYVVAFEGKTQDVSRHMIDMLDNVTLMDYRNSAIGIDGIVTHGMSEIDYATSHGKHVSLGVETIPQRSATTVFVGGVNVSTLRSSPLLYRGSMNGYRLQSAQVGQTMYIGLQVKGSVDARFRQALQNLAAQLGSAPESRVATLPDYSDFKPFDLPGYQAFSMQSIPLEKLSFAGGTQAAMEKVLKTVEQYFGEKSGFSGIAIHSYASYSEMPE